MWGMTLTKEKSTTKFHFQPELATSIIYWSVTFISFFISLIAVLEQFRVTWFNLTFFIIFLTLGYLGLQRYFLIEAGMLQVRYLLKRNRYTVDISQINKIAAGAYGITFYGSAWGGRPAEERVFLMLPKTKEKFLTTLESEPNFQGEIVSVKKSVGLD